MAPRIRDSSRCNNNRKSGHQQEHQQKTSSSKTAQNYYVIRCSLLPHILEEPLTLVPRRNSESMGQNFHILLCMTPAASLVYVFECMSSYSTPSHQISSPSLLQVVLHSRTVSALGTRARRQDLRVYADAVQKRRRRRRGAKTLPDRNP